MSPSLFSRFASLAARAAGRFHAPSAAPDSAPAFEVRLTPLDVKRDGSGLWSVQALVSGASLALPLDFNFARRGDAQANAYGALGRAGHPRWGDLEGRANQPGGPDFNPAELALLRQCARAIQRHAPGKAPFTHSLRAQGATRADPAVSAEDMLSAFAKGAASLNRARAPRAWRSFNGEAKTRLRLSAAPLSVDFDHSATIGGSTTRDNRAWLCWERADTEAGEHASPSHFLALQHFDATSSNTYLSNHLCEHSLSLDLLINNGVELRESDEYEGADDQCPESGRDPGLYSRMDTPTGSGQLLRDFFQRLPDSPAGLNGGQAPAVEFEIECFAEDAAEFRALTRRSPEPLLSAGEAIGALAQAYVLEEGLRNALAPALPPRSARL